MENLHSAWGFLFILGLFAVELGSNAIRSRRRKRPESIERRKATLRPYALHRKTRPTKTAQ